MSKNKRKVASPSSQPSRRGQKKKSTQATARALQNKAAEKQKQPLGTGGQSSVPACPCTVTETSQAQFSEAPLRVTEPASLLEQTDSYPLSGSGFPRFNRTRLVRIGLLLALVCVCAFGLMWKHDDHPTDNEGVLAEENAVPVQHSVSLNNWRLPYWSASAEWQTILKREVGWSIGAGWRQAPNFLSTVRWARDAGWHRQESVLPMARFAEGISFATVAEKKIGITVLMVGDSLMGWGLGSMLQSALHHAHPDITIKRYSKPSTGLSRKDFFDWMPYLAELVAEHRPDLVVVCLGANDAQTVMGDPGERKYIVGTPLWGEAYQRRAEEFIKTAQSDGARLVWVGLPIVGVEPTGSFIRELSLRQQAACDANPAAEFVDNYLILADDKKQYIASILGKDNKSIRLRNKDKIHVTNDGGKMLADHVMPCILRNIDGARPLVASRVGNGTVTVR